MAAAKMTRAHFVFIAETIRDHYEPQADAAEDRAADRANVAEAFARRLAATNPNFDSARFLRACEVDA
jgi:hypothetical protein